MLQSCQYTCTCLRLPAPLSEWGPLTRMESRLENRNSVILHDFQHQPIFLSPSGTQPAVHPRRRSRGLGTGPRQRTFNICNSVVFPALSRPRNRSFACLFRSPSDARVSQTIEQITISSPSSLRLVSLRGSANVLLTPVDNPHLGYVITGWRFRY
jgi:hypothetical protein